MKITIRQMDGCLSAMEAGHAKMANRIQLKKFIDDMIKNRLDEIEVSDNDKFGICITEKHIVI